MLASENVVRIDASAYAIRAAYNWISNSTKAPDDDKAVATVREIIYGNIAGIRKNASDANNLISLVQTLDAAATAIGEKLSRMKELAEQVVDGLYWSKGKAKMQEELEELAGEINEIAENTKYDGNKLFTDDGETISVPLGDHSTIQIFASDLRVDINGLDLTTNAAGALEALEAMIKNTDEYNGHLSEKAERLEEAMATIELDFGKTLDVEWSDFNTIQATKIVIHAASESLVGSSRLLDIQAKITPTAAKRLLEYNGPYIYRERAIF
jgi:flagellin